MLDDFDFSNPDSYYKLAQFLDDLADGFSNAQISVEDHNGVLDSRLKAVYAVSMRDQAMRTRKIGNSIRPRYENTVYRVGGANFVPPDPETQG